MDLLLKPDVILEYFEGIFQASKDELGQLIYNIINNDTNSFILNKKIVDQYEELLNEKFNDNIDTYYPFLNEILSKQIDVKVEKETNDCFEDIEKYYLLNSNHSNSVIYSDISIKKDNKINKQYSCVIEDITFPNINWIISQLACLKSNSLTVRYYDFKSDIDVKEFFDNLFTITNRYNMVYIYDRQINFAHNLFDLIKDTRQVHYYTTYSSNNKDINKNFRRVKIFKTNRNQIHERKIVISDLVIEVDNDFWNLRCSELTWKIDISLCMETANKITSKNGIFKRSY